MSCSRCAFAILIGICFAGCGTFDNLNSTNVIPYGGVAHDIEFAKHGNGYVEDIIFRPVAVIDTPISLVADTVTLPIALYAVGSRFAHAKAEENKKQAAQRERERVVTTPPAQDEPSLSDEKAID